MLKCFDRLAGIEAHLKRESIPCDWAHRKCCVDLVICFDDCLLRNLLAIVFLRDFSIRIDNTLWLQFIQRYTWYFLVIATWQLSDALYRIGDPIASSFDVACDGRRSLHVARFGLARAVLRLTRTPSCWPFPWRS